MTKILFRVVLDTNVVISSQNDNPHSPNREILNRWIDGEFLFLYSDDILSEYIEKLLEHRIAKKDILELVISIKEMGYKVDIAHFYFHTYQYPKDSDDIMFILCADNGGASHLVTYDSGVLEVNGYHTFTICKPLEFLKEIRAK